MKTKGKKKPQVEGKESHPRVKLPEHIRSHLRVLSDLLPKLVKAEKLAAARKEGWLITDGKQDTKADDGLIALLKKEFAFVRTAGRAAIGNKVFRTTAPMPFSIQSTVTTGVTNTILTGGAATFSATGITEQSSFNALFDEVKVHGGVVDFLYTNCVTRNAAAGLSADARPVIGYDPGDSTVAASTSAVIQLAQHMTMDVPIVSPASTNFSALSNHHRFRFEIPRGDYIASSSAFVGDVWQDFSNAQPNGAIKFYHIGTEVTSNIVGSGQLILDLSFRCRQ